MLNKTTFTKAVSITDDAFIEMVNHELKSPLTTIKIFIETLERKLPKDNKYDLTDNIKKVDQKIDHLTSLINDYTDVVRLQTGALVFEFEKLLSEPVFKNCFKKIKNKFNNISIETPKFPNKKILVNKQRLYQAFNNLIIYMNKVGGEDQKIQIKSKFKSRYMVFNLREVNYKYSNNKELEYIDPETINQKQIKPFNLKQNLRIGSFLAEEIIKSHQGKFLIYTDSNSKIACCFSIPFSS